MVRRNLPGTPVHSLDPSQGDCGAATKQWRMEISTPPPSAGAAKRAARLQTPRLKREQATMLAMLRLYCADRHGSASTDSEGLCTACAELLAYSRKRLAACPFGPDKPTCVNCQIHCYGPQQREETRVVMRYAGPRMLLRHPFLAIAHIIDGRRPAPPKPRGASAADTAAPQPPAGKRT